MTYQFDPNRITYFAMTDVRNQRRAFGIKAKDRDRHMYVIGKTGMGKSTMLENMAIQDIQNGEGLCFIDPHGSSAEKLLEYIPQDRINDVLYFAPFDTNFPIAFNVMEDVGYDKRHLVASGLMSAFHRIWGPEVWSARMEYILQNALLALLEYPGTTLVDVNPLLFNETYRKRVVSSITDPIVKQYWEKEFANYPERYKQEAVAAIQNKIGQFVSNPLVRNIISQPKSSFDPRAMMDERRIMIVNLSKGRIGETNADLIGSMLIVKIYLAAMSRAEESSAMLKSLSPFYLYVDEFQSVVNESFSNILSEARKYKLSLTMAHQFIEQVPEEVRAAVFGNVGTTITFRVGPFDAEVLEKMFDPTFMATDIVGLGFAQIYLSLMIDGVGSRPFSARTLPPIAEPKVNYIQEILDHSRVTFAKPRDVVEAAILKSTQGYDQKSERPDSGRPREGGASRDFIRNGDQRDAPRRAETRTDIRKPEYRSDTRRDVPDFKRDTRDIREPREEKSYRGVNRPEPIKKASAEAAPAESTPQLTEDHRAKLRAALQKISEKERAQNEKIRGRESADHTTEIPLQAHVNSATHSETVQVDPPKTQAYTTTDQEVSEDTLRQLLGADAV